MGLLVSKIRGQQEQNLMHGLMGGKPGSVSVGESSISLFDSITVESDFPSLV